MIDSLGVYVGTRVVVMHQEILPIKSLPEVFV